MSSQVTNYKCPACTGPLHYAGASGKLECDYCGSTYDTAEIEAMYAEKEQAALAAFQKAEEKSKQNSEWNTTELTNEWGAEGEGMKAYNCPSCGAELICDATTAATSCPYCGNQTIVPGQFSGTLKPDCILPFKLDQKAAEAALKKHYEGKRFLPKAYANDNRIKEIKGVYVPFWMFDGTAYADIQCKAEKSRTRRTGDKEIKETEHYFVRRAGAVAFKQIPVDASTKMPDAHMDAIEPFNYEELKPFSSIYLPGYLADKYDLSAEACAERADNRAAQSAIDVMRSDISGYDTWSMENHDVQLERGKVQYGLLPVYMLNTKWEGKDYLFAMNGQTGKLIGDLPIDNKLYWTWFLGLTGVLTAVIGTLLLLVL